MAKSIHDDVLDAALNYIKTNGDKMTVCEGEPTTYEHANSQKGTGTGKALGSAVLASGDYTVTADSSGRKVTIAAQADEDVDQTGDGDHVAIVDTANSKLLKVATCTLQALVAGNKVSFPAWKINIQDPT